MARCDYIICDRCDGKAFYDGYGNVRNSLPDEYVVFCEPCARAVKADCDLLEAVVDAARVVAHASPKLTALLANLDAHRGEG